MQNEREKVNKGKKRVFNFPLDGFSKLLLDENRLESFFEKLLSFFSVLGEGKLFLLISTETLSF